MSLLANICQKIQILHLLQILQIVQLSHSVKRDSMMSKELGHNKGESISNSDQFLEEFLISNLNK